MNLTSKTAYDLALQLRFDDARRMMASEKSENPDNYADVLIENYIDFFEVFLLQDADYYESHLGMRSSRIAALDKIPDDVPYKRWSQSLIELQWAFGAIKMRDNYAAAQGIRRSFALIEKNKKAFPDFVPNEMVSGVLHAVVGAIPPNYKWLLKIISMEGTVEQGKRELMEMLNKTTSCPDYRWLFPETLFYLSFIENTFDPFKKDIEDVLAHYPENYSKYKLLIFSKAELEMRLGDMQTASSTLATRNDAKGVRFYYLDFLEAEMLLRKVDFSAAQKYQLFISESQSDDRKIDAKRKMAWIYFLQGDTTAYYSMMKNISKMKCGENESDKEAVNEAKAGQLPIRELLLARLYYDGSNYQKSLDALKTLDESSLSEVRRLEYDYRMARAFEGLNENGKAVTSYKKAIERGANSTSYYPANAALKLAELYEMQGDKISARYYYSKCLDMNPEEYRNGIFRKAKEGLNRAK